MQKKSKGGTQKELESALGDALEVWVGIIALLEEHLGPIDREWKPSKSNFGRMCLLKHKKRTLLYLIPEVSAIRVAIVLGERAADLALASKLPKHIKTLIKEARPYAEGRGIRFSVDSASDISNVSELVAIKITPNG